MIKRLIGKAADIGIEVYALPLTLGVWVVFAGVAWYMNGILVEPADIGTVD